MISTEPPLNAAPAPDMLPPLQGPTPKEKKYDRQLRLWAANGQAALEQAHILLVNSGSGVAGVEALKNLVLPGIGRFTILDSAIVTEEDLGVNFFLTDSDVGQSRGKSCCRYLEELNPDVTGAYIAQTPEDFLSDEVSQRLAAMTLILVTLPLAPEVLEIISQHAQRTAVPVFYVHSLGFYSHFTVQLPAAFPIVDTHPDPSSTTDLRLLGPWDDLLEYSKHKTANLDQMDDEQHGHVPYLLLLLHYLEVWRSNHNGLAPRNYKEKAEFRTLVQQGARTHNAEGGEENFDEAVAAVLKSLNPPAPSSAVKEVFAAVECQNLTSSSADFWIIAHAIHEFYVEHDVLPLAGGLPDMKAKSADYIDLQNMYKSKARQDVTRVMSRVQSLESELKKTSTIEQKEIEAFCKCAASIKLVRGRQPHFATPQSLIQWGDRAGFALEALQNPDSLILLYIALLAFDTYAANHAMVNQVGEQRCEASENADTELLKKTGIAHIYVDKLISEAGANIEDPEYTEIKSELANIIAEMVRAGSGELHNIAAVTGGAVAQEVIKVITKQYIPVNNTFLFDGISSKTSVLLL